MSRYYKGKQAHQYNIRWQRFNTKTLTETLAMIDFTALHGIQERQGRLPRVLDVACGTGLLLKQLLAQVPGIEAYGLDASADMLAQSSGRVARTATCASRVHTNWKWHGFEPPIRTGAL